MSGWGQKLLGPNGRFWLIVLKNSKIAGLRKSRNVAFGRIQPRQRSVKSIRAPVSGFAVIDVVPRVEASEAHQGALRIFDHQRKGVFQHNRRKADIG
jgi:hypothetical protein